MKKTILILSILVLALVAGCVTTQYQNPSCVSNEDCSDLSENAVCIDGTCQLLENNSPSLKEDSSDVVTIPHCKYYLKVGSYDGSAEDVAPEVAYNILKERDSRIKMEHLEVDTTPYVSFKTDPPSPAEGEIIYPLLKRDGEAESINVESSGVVLVRISTDFYNEFQEDGCATYNNENQDGSCISDLHFANGEVFIEFGNPC
tara:strand:+ start:275 stop:880 length:606 start_codon:yes stop_codon:yes gene_type:complete